MMLGTVRPRMPRSRKIIFSLFPTDFVDALVSSVGFESLPSARVSFDFLRPRLLCHGPTSWSGSERGNRFGSSQASELIPQHRVAVSFPSHLPFPLEPMSNN